MNLIESKWEAVGSIVRTVYDKQTGGCLFVCDCWRRHDGKVEFSAGNAGEVAAEIARLHNLAVDQDYATKEAGV
jgi:hypothetical protein